MNMEKEAELTEINTRTDNLAVTEEDFLMKLSQLILQNNKAKKHIKRQ